MSVWRWMGQSLRRKLTLMMLVISLIPLLFLGGFAFVISSKITEEKTEQAGIDTLRQMDANLRFIIKDVENMSIFMIGQSNIQQYVNALEEDVGNQTRILSFMTNLIASKEYISNITIVPANSNPPLSTTNLYQSDLDKMINIREVSGKLWTTLYTVENYAGKQNVISFIRPLRSVDNYRNLGWLTISIDEKAISKYWSEPKLGEGQGEVALLNEQGIVLSATNKGWLSQPFDSLLPGMLAAMKPDLFGVMNHGEGATKKTILYFREPIVKWKLVGVIPFDLYSAQNRYILLLTGVAVAVSIIATVGLILFLIQRVTNPLRVLTRLLTKVNPEEPLPLYSVASSDEIGKLGESYNMLGNHIEKLKVQVIRNEAHKKEADMRALQAQINPHFLYNTLSSIHWIALMNDEKRIADMVGSLSDFLRFSLNKGNEFCPVHQELAHIKNYTQVQSIRYPDKFDLDMVVDPDLQDKYMLKLLLQPLVENAMIHGIQKKEGKGMITVYVEQKASRISFLVLDDGVGMTNEQLQAIRRNLNPQGGEQYTTDANYGLRNVNERLQLHYGNDAGLIIESRPNAGTRVSFSIPILEGQHENHDRG
ncbi:cache domain-containing sensor histidine kinase [Paenibacillus agricola]|uniref:Sensor histidine kinase n=1 Tax=Paenibacillus agricola TaxID=2716264 RepID=A0ABX0J6T6_9BACL|nr:sensor histidine kinase [Paenibacillus agricola]NHN31323.1 sensor histidine kinase [Paenibacillus agricola]